MKKELVIPLGITFIAGILIMLAGCGNTPFNPLPKIQITNQSDGMAASGAATVSASYTINVYGPDIYVYSSTDSLTTASGTSVASAAAESKGFFHTQPNNGTTAATIQVTVTYSTTGITPGTVLDVTRVYSYYTIPGNVYGTFPVTYRIIF